jgi:MscS family membrane protein
LVYSTPPEQVEAFVEGIKAIIKASPSTRKDFFEVHFNSFGDHSLNVLIYMFFKVPDWSAELQARHNFLLQVLQLAHEIGVEFAFPTQTLHVDSFFQDEPREVGKKYSAKELIRRLKQYGPQGSKTAPDGLQLEDEGKPVNYRP